MASITKRGSTYQYTVSRYVEGKPKHIRKGGFRTKKEAVEAAKEVEYLLAKGNEVKIQEISFSDYFEKWVDLYKQGKHKNTLARYQNSVERVKEYFKDLPIQKINRNLYQEFLNQYGRGKSKETVRKLNTHIRSCVKDSIEDGYITVDFTRKAEFIATKSAKKAAEKHLNYMDSFRLYRTLKSKLDDSNTNTLYLILLALVSGMRYGELVGLTIDKFNFKNNTIKVERSFDYKEGIGKNGDGFDDLKNQQSERIIAIDPSVMKEFHRLFEDSPRHPQDLVFYRPSKVKVLSNEGANKVLKKLLTDLNIDSITMHGLRHTHASILLYKGLSIHSVSKRLGHADIQTTLDHYAHVLKEMEKRDEKLAMDLFSKASV
ncbi:tyrosine-type recombinase/integrase [Lysinibacillus sp. SGAir0095]|uniref:site-specific integrase n=1 Tax=Lysinibacillus sp. SGAir0095 TaxID=2070463 RepID=UPI0010CCF9B6|nr:tyrosine-type recombinase/integrase [Lysinibacillus sp. SGAir0095]QCR33167.1 site-specific integrase [Lysinibacillus sp. SGAir0095]